MSTATKTRPTKKNAPSNSKPPARTKTAPPPVETTKPTTSGSVEMPATLLKKILAVVTPAASDDEARPVLCNVAIEIDEQGLTTWMATDSYRLHVAKPTHLVVDGGPATGQIPAKWLQRWARGKTGKFDTVTLKWDDNSATISCGDLTDHINCWKVSEFPAVKPVLAKAAASTDMQLSAFNPRYLAAAMGACSKWGDNSWHPVRLDPLAPGLFTSTHPDDGVLTVLLMPVRVP